MPIKQHSKQLGFSLVELAIVLLIVTLLLGGLLVPLNAQIDQQRTKETQKTLAELKESLLGFAIVNGRLPCPATTASNGQESFCTSAAGACIPTSTYQTHGKCSNFFDGLVPAAALGITPVNAQGLLQDGWNNAIRYAVNDKIGSFNYALTNPNGIKNATINTLMGATLITVCSNAVLITTICGPLPTTTKLTDSAPALIYSLGKNGNTGNIGPDELANAQTNIANKAVFVSHEQSPAGGAFEDFDDMVAWIPSGILINRLVAAGQLP